MDLEAYTASARPNWRRLERLTRQRRLRSAEVDELVRLYQGASTDLAALSSTATDPDVVMELSRIVSRARGRIGGTDAGIRSALAQFFTVTLPVAMYRIGPLFVLTWVFSLFVALVSGIYAATNPEILTSQGPEYELQQYAQDAFKAYYTNYPAPDFAAQVWTNNARVAVIMVATFFTGFYPAYILISNFANVGIAGAIMYTYGDIWVFFGLITPHGILELSCVVLAGAVALRLMWAVLVPGKETRAVSLAREGRTFVPVGVGLILLLAIAGLEEGFLTPSTLLPGVKILVACAVMAVLVCYIVFFARRALRQGLTPDIAWDRAGYAT